MTIYNNIDGNVPSFPRNCNKRKFRSLSCEFFGWYRGQDELDRKFRDIMPYGCEKVKGA